MKGYGLRSNFRRAIIFTLVLGIMLSITACSSPVSTSTAAIPASITASVQSTTTSNLPASTSTPTAAISTGTSLQSPDGSLTLTFPAGALPSGIDVSSIQVTKMAKDDPAMPTVDNQAPLAYYSLEPEGLKFSTSAAFKVTLPFSGTTIPMPFLLSSTSGLDFPDNIIVKLDIARGTVDISGDISHFSGLGIAIECPFTITMENPGTRMVGSTFTASGMLVGSNQPFTIKQKDAQGVVTTYSYALEEFGYLYRFNESGTELHISPGSTGISVPILIKKGQQPDSLTAEFTPVSPYAKVDFAMDLTITTTLTIWSSSGGTPVPKYLTFMPELYCNFSIVKPWTSGNFQLVTVVNQDPAGQASLIMLSPTITAQVDVRGDPSVTISGDGNWVTVSGEINPDGTFTATGIGTVAGHSDVNVKFAGTWTEENGFSGTYTMGSGGELPSGQSITYTVKATRL